MVARSDVVIVNCINLGSATTSGTTTDSASFGSASMGSIAACTTPVLYGISIRFDIRSAIMGGSDVNIGSSTGSANRDTTSTDGANLGSNSCGVSKKLGAEVF